MTDWPTVDRDSLLLPTLPGHDDALWNTLIELTDLRPGEWTLIGGQMVFLHAIERAATPPRVSTDLDVLVNARIVTGGVAEFVAAIELRGFNLEGASPEGLAHRYRRNGVSIDVLAPEGLGPAPTSRQHHRATPSKFPMGPKRSTAPRHSPSTQPSRQVMCLVPNSSAPSLRRRWPSMSTTPPMPNTSTSPSYFPSSKTHSTSPTALHQRIADAFAHAPS
ncbi:MAG: hypothetical protein GY722_22050 [bacterium]|nr:hypothetical protein [bacterium]